MVGYFYLKLILNFIVRSFPVLMVPNRAVGDFIPNSVNVILLDPCRETMPLVTVVFTCVFKSLLTPAIVYVPVRFQVDSFTFSADFKTYLMLLNFFVFKVS